MTRPVTRDVTAPTSQILAYYPSQLQKQVNEQVMNTTALVLYQQRCKYKYKYNYKYKYKYNYKYNYKYKYKYKYSS